MDCIDRGETPMAGHLLYTQVLDDDTPIERALGLTLHLAWLELLAKNNGKLVVYTNYGISPGMQRAIDLAEALGMPIDYRTAPWR